MQRARRTPSRAAALAVAAVALLAALAVATSAGGPVDLGEPRLPGLVAPAGGGDLDLVGDEPAEDTDDGPADPASVPWASIGLLLACTLLAAVVLRMFRRADDSDRAVTPAPPPPVGADDPGGSTLVALRSAVADAEDRLGRAAPGQARDAVVACWVSLEAAAAVHGAARRPAQTPTEFTAALLDASTADPAATARLLGLYHRARFGRTPLPDAAADDAAGALHRIGAGLGRVRTATVTRG